jgi:hypothetical protein
MIYNIDIEKFSPLERKFLIYLKEKISDVYYEKLLLLYKNDDERINILNFQETF